MEYLFGAGKTSVVEHAQKVVADLEIALNEKNEKINSLEAAMQSMSGECISFMESDLSRLSQRRRELAVELSHLDAAIQERGEAIARAKGVLKEISRGGSRGGMKSDASLDGVDVKDLVLSSSKRGSDKDAARLSYLKKSFSSTSETVDDLTDPDVLARIVRNKIDSLLFTVDRSDANDLVAYVVPEEESSDIVSAYRVSIQGNQLDVQQLGAYEWMVAFGVKVVPNHEREDPSTVELPGIGSRPDSTALAELMGAIEVPVAPDVIIDVWRIDKEPVRVWSTTTIDGVAFCQLERISLISESHWGLSSVVEVTLYGRHPFTGAAVVEIIDMRGTDENEDDKR